MLFIKIHQHLPTMTNIKFIYETRANRIFMSILSAAIVVLSAIAIWVDGDISDFLFGIASGGLFYILLGLGRLFWNKNFVYVGHNYLLVRINTFFFKTILFDRVESVDISETVQHIHLRNKDIQIQTEGINDQDVSRLQMLISTLVKA